MLVMVPVLYAVLKCRRTTLQRLLKERQRKENTWMANVEKLMSNWRLVNSYNLRDKIAENFKSIYIAFHKARAGCGRRGRTDPRGRGTAAGDRAWEGREGADGGGGQR